MADDVGGGNGAANSGVAGNVELADAIGSKEVAPGGGVGLGVVVGVVAVEGRGLLIKWHKSNDRKTFLAYRAIFRSS